jgi:oligopeptidase B
MKPMRLSLTLSFALLYGCGGSGTDGPLASSDKTDKALGPPVAKKVPHPVTMNGDTRQDDYYWIRDQAAFSAWQKDPSKGIVLQDPDVDAYLTAENDYTDKASAHTQPLQDKMVAEMQSRVGTGAGLNPDYPWGSHQYYERQAAGQTYPVFFRKPLTGTGPEETVLDPNALAGGASFYSIKQRIVSPDESLVAFTVDTTGNSVCTLVVRNIATGQTTQVNNQVSSWFGIAFGAGSDSIFYVTVNGETRSDKVWSHPIGADPTKDVLVYEEKDDSLLAFIRPARSGKYVFIESGYGSTYPTSLVLSATNPTAPPIPVVSMKGQTFRLEHEGDFFYILTDLGAEDFRVVRAPVATPTMDHWEDVIPGSVGTLISQFATFQDNLVALERVNGLYKLAIQNLRTNEKHEVSFDEADFSLDLGWNALTFVQDLNPNFSQGSFRFTYESMVTPKSTREYHFSTQEQTIVQQTDVPNYDPTRYEESRVFATASDGAQVPITLVYKKGMVQNGQNPLILYAYGSYGEAIDPTFSEWTHDSTVRVSLLDRGVVYGIAHVRGGNEMGQHWFKQGVFMNKKNTFTDYAACLRYLIDNKYTSPDRAAMQSFSAGGLLEGYMLNNEYQLFKAALLVSPFVDLINTGSDATIPLTTNEYDQWGNPSDPMQYAYMRTWSPYDNVAAHPYPAALITTGVNDTSVFYWEPTKLTARIRANKTDDNLLLLKIGEHGHHGAATDATGVMKEDAFEYSFILDQIGATELVK